MTMEQKSSCIFFETLLDAAERIKGTDEHAALEIYTAYAKYALGRTDKIETDSMIAELVVMQNIPSLNAATNRYNAAVENGKKGKEYGELGKEYGKKGGRPRKGETKEEAKKRRENEVKTPQKTPLTVDVSEDVSVSVSEDVSVSKSISEDKTYSNTLSLNKGTLEHRDENRPGLGQVYLDDDLIRGLSDSERSIQFEYYYILKNLPTLEGKKFLFNDTCYLPETLDWMEEKNIYQLKEYMRTWNDGGRTELVQLMDGLATAVKKDVLTYLVLYCKASETSDMTYKQVYAR